MIPRRSYHDAVADPDFLADRRAQLDRQPERGHRLLRCPDLVAAMRNDPTRHDTLPATNFWARSVARLAPLRKR